MKKRISELVLAAVLLLSLAVPFNSCTGYLDFAGYVYEWTNPPPGSSSTIIEAESVPQGYQVKPMAGVTVSANDEDGSHPFTMVSRDDGYFQKGLTVEFQEDIIMKVNFPGYKNALLQFGVNKDKYFYTLIVLLVPAT